MVNHQRRTIGHLPPAVAIAVDIAVKIEQCLGSGRIVVECRRTLVDKAGHALGNRRPGFDGLIFFDNGDFFFDRVGHRNGAAQRDFFRRVATENFVAHIEGGVGQPGNFVSARAHAGLGQIGCELAARHRDIDEWRRNRAQVIVFTIEKGQPARLFLFNWRDFQAPDQWQALALEVFDNRLIARVIAAGGLEILLAIIRIGFEHDFRRASPLLQAKRAGTHRMFAERGAIKFNHFAGGRSGCRHRQNVGQVVIGGEQADDQRVLIRRGNTKDRFVVVEAAVALGIVCQGIPADQFAFHQKLPFGAHRGVEQALDAVCIIARHQFAFFSIERRVVGKVNAVFKL